MIYPQLSYTCVYNYCFSFLKRADISTAKPNLPSIGKLSWHKAFLQNKDQFVVRTELKQSRFCLKNSGMNCGLHQPLELLPVLMSFNG